MIRTRIIGTGSYVPPDILTNDNLSEMVDTSDEWIKTRTGICNRHIAKDMDNADMAYNAARNAVVKTVSTALSWLITGVLCLQRKDCV